MSINESKVEFYLGNAVNPFAIVASPMVPAVGQMISIVRVAYRVTSVTFALDYPVYPDTSHRIMRANVSLERV